MGSPPLLLFRRVLSRSLHFPSRTSEGSSKTFFSLPATASFRRRMNCAQNSILMRPCGPVNASLLRLRSIRPLVPAVAKLAAIAPVVTLSNSPAWHSHHHKTLALACAPYLTALYTSYGLGVPAKPDPAAFHLISARHTVPMDRIVAVGDRWSVDIVAALDANVGTIIWTSEKPNDCPAPQLITNGRVQVIKNISDVVPLIKRLTDAGSVDAGRGYCKRR